MPPHYVENSFTTFQNFLNFSAFSSFSKDISTNIDFTHYGQAPDGFKNFVCAEKPFEPPFFQMFDSFQKNCFIWTLHGARICAAVEPLFHLMIVSTIRSTLRVTLF